MPGKHFVVMRPPNMISAFLFQNADDMPDTVSRRILEQDMYMVFICLHSLDIPMMAFCRLKEHLFYVTFKAAGKYWLPIFRNKNKVCQQFCFAASTVMIPVLCIQSGEVSVHKIIIPEHMFIFQYMCDIIYMY